MKQEKVFKHHTELLEVQNSLVSKHDKMLKEMVSNSALNSKLEIIKDEIAKRTDDVLAKFSMELREKLNDKIDKSLFSSILNDKVAKKDLTKTNDTLTDFCEKFDFLNSIVEDLQTSTKADLNTFDIKMNQFKENSSEKQIINELKEKVERLENEVKEMNGEEFDEYDEVDSIEEDVLSLNRDNNFDSSVSNSNIERDVNQENENQEPNDDNDDFFNLAPIEKSSTIDKSNNEKNFTRKGQNDKPNNALENTIKLLPMKSESNKNIALKDDQESPLGNIVDKILKSNSNSPQASFKKEESRKSSPKNSPLAKLKTQVEGLTVKTGNESFQKRPLKRGSTISSRVMDDDNDFNEEESPIEKNNANRRLSRMSSKLSSMSKTKKAGFKGKMEEITKKIKEMSLNLERTMEDVKKIKSQEKERDDIIKASTDAMKILQNSHDRWNQDNEEVKLRQNQIDSVISETIKTIKSKAKEVSNTHTDIIKAINDFKEEYKEGFRRILKCEINIREIKNNINLLQKKLKDSEKESNSQINVNKMMCKIDAQFDILYKRIKTMADDQSEFNVKIK